MIRNLVRKLAGGKSACCHDGQPSFLSLYLLCALCVLCGKSFALSAPQEVVPVMGAPFAGELLSIDADGNAVFQVQGKNEPAIVALSDLVRWGNPVAARAQTILVLPDGSRLVTAADWAGGAAVQLKGSHVTVLSDTWGPVSLERELVRGVVFVQRERGDKRERLVEQLLSGADSADGANREEKAKDDAITLVNGDRLTGNITALERGSLTLKTAGGETKLPLSRVETIRFRGWGAAHAGSPIATEAEPSARPFRQGRGILVGARDGSLVRAVSIEASASGTKLQLENGVELNGGSVVDIAAVQVLGGNFVYLSDLTPASYRFVPYLQIEWPIGRDRCVTGAPLMVNGKRYPKGLGLHTAGRVTYKLEAPYQRFDAMIAIDDAAHARGSVLFGAYVERDGKWVEGYKSDVVRGGELPRQVSVDLQGATGLTLTVDYADRGDELDYADWLDARLVR